MTKNYVRLSEGLTSYKLIPETDDIWNHIKSNEKDYYLSLYQYNQEHFDQWVKTKTVSGIKNTTTKKLLFDFDNATNPEAARQDAVTVVSRLLSKGIPAESVQVAFSGNKGFSVEVDTGNTFTQDEFKNITFALASDLSTFDRVVNDPNRIVRVVGTKHPKSGLYKFPLSVDQLTSMSIVDIKLKAANLDNVDYKVMDKWNQVTLPESILSLKTAPEKKEPKKELVTDLDMTLKPKWLSEAKYALQEGHFLPGERNTAFMILASTYKNQGFNKEITYRLLKGVAEVQSRREGQDRYSDDELWNNVIRVVFDDNWKGGQYAYDTTPLLQQVTARLNLKKPDEESKPLVFSELGGDNFKRYAKSFYETRIYTGLPNLDEAFPICAGSNVAIVGAASSGKCLGKDTPIRMFDGSVKMVQDVVVGDLLMGDDSTPRKVLSTCSGQENLYKVIQSSGMNYVVNESHILSLKSNQDKLRSTLYEVGKVIDINVKDYLKQGRQFKRIYRGFHARTEYPTKQIHLDPYFVGLWLGDGKSEATSIFNTDKEIINYLQTLAESYGYDLINQITNENKCPQWNISNTKGKPNLIRDGLRGYELLNNKHIPKQYLINDRVTRLKVLAGLIDSDGHYDSKKHAYEVTFKNEILAKDLQMLCRSLGFRCTKRTKQTYCFYKGEKQWGTYFRMYISGESLNEIPCLLLRKQAAIHKPVTDSTMNSIKVEFVGYGDYYGFEIDGNRRFLLEDYTVTHNTALSLNILKKMSETNSVSVFASLDMSRSRLYEKLLYSVTHGKKSREEIYNDYITGNGKKYDDLVKEAFPQTFIFAKSSPSIDELRNYINKVQDHTGKPVRLLLIDYFERLTSVKSDDTAASKDVASGIQDLIADFPELTPITLYQPNKFSLGGGPDKPIMNYTAIKGSSFIIQSARQILSLWRPFFTPEFKDCDKFMEMAILKNDLGELGKFCYKWTGKTGGIEMMSDEDALEYQEYMARKQMAENTREDW